MYHALSLLASKFYKIIEVNLDDGTYFEIKVDDDEKPIIYKDVNYWAAAFAAVAVYPADRTRFLEFFQPFKLKAGVEQQWQRVYYRRNINNTWRWVCMEVLPNENFSQNDPIVLIVVRDVQEYIKDFEEQIECAEREEEELRAIEAMFFQEYE